MSLRLPFLSLVCLCTSLLAQTSQPPAPSTISAEEMRAQFTLTRAIVTGTVEGITEYIPVSSTGHMIISDEIMGVKKDKNVIISGVADRKNRPINQEKAVDDYIVIIQLGAILAVIAAFFTRLKNLVLGIIRLEKPSLCLATCVMIAFVPAGIIGLLVKDIIAFDIKIVASALILGGLVIFWAEKKLPNHPSNSDEVQQMNFKQALQVGLCQCVALIPGTSRSLATILGGRWAGLSNGAATEFSFLVGLVTLTAASLYKMVSLGPALTQIYPIHYASLGLIIATITAFISVKWMIGFITRRGLGPFAWYRIILGTGILIFELSK
ncbi:undecaprenyl-diphosphate phosphatase [bacterium]|nr:undecaprenyl-diphosphate phosphatase [bacterium]